MIPHLDCFYEGVVDEDVLLLRLNKVVPLTPDMLQESEHVERLLQLNLETR